MVTEYAQVVDGVTVNVLVWDGVTDLGLDGVLVPAADAPPLVREATEASLPTLSDTAREVAVNASTGTVLEAALDPTVSNPTQATRLAELERIVAQLILKAS